MLSGMDQTVKPCDDFYEFVCGRYMDGKKEKLQSLSETFVIESKMLERMLTTLNDEIKPKESKTNQVVKKFFQSCMNYNEIEEKGTTYLKDIIGNVGGWPCVEGDNWNEENFQWQDMQFELLKKGFLESYLVGAERDDDGMLLVSEPPLIISQDILQQGMENKDVKTYLKYLVSLAVRLGANYSTAEADMADVIELEETIITQVALDSFLDSIQFNFHLACRYRR